MDDLIETLWTQFAIETEEHLEALEAFLLEAEAAHPVDIAAIFRAFHSIKGLSRAMDLHSMQEVAHVSEDLLGLAREKKIFLDPALARLLLTAVDSLKGLRQLAVDDRANGALPVALVEQLRARYAQAASGATQVAAPKAPLPTAPPPTASISHVSEPSPSPVAPDPAPPPAAAGAEELEMLRFFAELLITETPRLATILLEEFHTTPGERALVEDSLDALIQASEVMEFPRMAELLMELKAGLPGRWPLSPHEQEALTSQFMEFRTLAEQVKNQAGVEACVVDLPVALQRTFRDEVARHFQELIRLLDSLQGGRNDEMADEDLAARITRITSAINGYLLFFQCEHACYLMLLMQDVYHHVKASRLFITKELLEISLESVALVEAFYLATQTGEPPPPQEQMEKLLNRLRRCLFVGNTGRQGEDTFSAVQEFLQQVELPPELLELLTPGNLHDLTQAIQQGGRPYEIIAEMESNPAVTMGLVAWMQAETTPITNRAMLSRGGGVFQHLVVSRRTSAEITQRFRELDPTGTLLSVRMCVMKATSEARPGPRKEDKRPETTPSQTPTGGAALIRVPGEVLDAFMNQIGEMVLARSRIHHVVVDEPARLARLALNSLLQRLRKSGALSSQETEEIRCHLDALKGQQAHLVQADAQLHTNLVQLQEKGLALRVVPIDTVFKRFPRMVRDLAQAQGKDIRLLITGQEVRIDKGMVDALVDPLLHMVRNGVDHGVETEEERRLSGKSPQATVTLSAVQNGNRVVVAIADDGRGIDAERVRAKAVERGLVGEAESLRLPQEQIFQFIFQPGFSTAQRITETSGRGVGMDVVRTSVLRLGGTITITSQLGAGSCFTMELPLSAAIQDTLLVSAAGQPLAIPDRFVTEVLEVEIRALQSVKGRTAMLLREAVLPVLPLAALLGRPNPLPSSLGALQVVVISNGKQRLGVAVDQVLGRRELFIKDMNAQLTALPGVGGASILGDGRVVLILDGEDLLRLAQQGAGLEWSRAFAQQAVA